MIEIDYREELKNKFNTKDLPFEENFIDLKNRVSKLSKASFDKITGDDDEITFNYEDTRLVKLFAEAIFESVEDAFKKTEEEINNEFASFEKRLSSIEEYLIENTNFEIEEE